jgi:CHAD domain-containing protein
MQRFEAFLPGTRLDIDSEFVHQARVATRRMRSALRLFRGALPEATAKHLERELRWLGQVFGEVRDLDVFLLNLPGFVKAIETKPRKQVNILKRWIDDHRDPFLEDLIEALDSKRLDSFRKRLANFLERPLPKRPRAPLALRPVQEVAPEIIGAKYDSVISRGRKTFSKPKLKNFHSLRIQTKKLRYACEFMAPAYGPALTGFIKKTVRIQDCLGELQDTVFTRAFIEVIVDDWKNKIVDPDMLFMLGEIYQLQGEIAQRRIDSFAGIWEEFDVDSVSGELKGILNGGRKEGKADKAPETAVDDGPPRLK